VRLRPGAYESGPAQDSRGTALPTRPAIAHLRRNAELSAYEVLEAPDLVRPLPRPPASVLIRREDFAPSRRPRSPAL